MKNYCIIPFFRGIKAFFSFYQQIPLAMKLFIFILCFFVGTVYSADSYSQSVSMNAKSQTVKSVLNEIEKQAGVSFFINNKNIDLERKVSISASNSKIDKILSTLFSGTNVRYHIIGDQVILSSKEEKENVSSLNSAQQKTVTIKGLVTDPDGNPLIGVSVMQSGTSNGAITDIDGRYSIKAPVGSKLVYSYVGFVTDEKIIKAGMTTINIRLLESSESLGRSGCGRFRTAKEREYGGFGQLYRYN
ncbi:carboxypeptidase-like regulatory domain-containing protein [Bacteroides thetaiotaomicron]|nr:carboxypeptidase-like regulatory domain-containing protein [Bacteroides thetaiotaomicron]